VVESEPVIVQECPVVGAGDEGDMHESLTKVAEPASVAPSAGKLKLVALGRCKYSDKAGAVYTAETGDVINDPNLKDLADLEEAGLVESFDEDAVAALRSVAGKNKKALRAILGL
jgi:hypothetical protein